MLLYSSKNSIYKIDGSRMDLAKEYRDKLKGPYSFELQSILDRMRTSSLNGRFVLIVIEPFKRFGLARLSGKRGEPPKIIDDVIYNSISEAEWDIFKRRWFELTGYNINIKDPS
mgnify:FL=1